MGLPVIEHRPLTSAYGAELFDLDLRSISAETGRRIAAALDTHGALVIRNQKLTAQQFQDFVGIFGEAEGHTLPQFSYPGLPNVYVLSNRIENGRPVGAHNDGLGWHTDYAYREEPVLCTMLNAVTVPPEGSDTLLADMCAAFESLPPERQKALEGLQLHHSYEHIMRSRPGGAEQLTDEVLAENPDVVHPLIRTQPHSGRKALWVSRGTKGVVGMGEEEGLALIDELVALVTEERFIYRHKWQVGDVLVWDNRRTLHRGTPYDDTKYIREMWRMWVKGGRPV